MSAPDLLARADERTRCEPEYDCLSSSDNQLIRDLAAALRAVAQVHFPLWDSTSAEAWGRTSERHCGHDRAQWPCETARLLAEHGVAVVES